MGISIGLIGNPNCGKTTMFNELTGSSQYVGNWPGVTVEKKEGNIKDKKGVKLVDLPGIYSLSPYTLEEDITRNYLFREKPDAIINIVDASNIERNLYLSTQIIEIGIPTIIALNMIDIVEKRGDVIDKEKLSNALGCPVIETSALKGKGLNELIESIIKLVDNNKNQFSYINENKFKFSDKLEESLDGIEKIIDGMVLPNQIRWFSTKIFEKDEKILREINISNEATNMINEIISSMEQELDDKSDSIIINERYNFISDLVSQIIKKKDDGNMTFSDKIDLVLTNKFLSLPIFIGVIFLVYYISVTSVGTIVTDWTNDVFFGEYIVGIVESLLNSIHVADWLHSLIIDGIIGGVGAVLGFVPQMFILFFFLSILEDCGYMSRIAFIMDKIFRKFGLSGKSFIPILISSGCGVPGIMSSRTIESEKDRKITIMVTTFIPCGAKLPVIALFGTALFPGNPFIGPSIYFLGIIVIIISGIILKKMKIFAGEPCPFVMELPQYHIPSLKGIFIHMWERVRSFIVKAGTVIFVASAIIWFLSNFNFNFVMVEPQYSILASIGNFFAPIFNPLGFGTWQATIATINGLVAKEQLVSTFGILLGLGEVSEMDTNLTNQIGTMFNSISAYSFIAFNMLCAPCFAAIGAIKREMGNWKWTFIVLLYQTLTAYIVSFIIYNLGSSLILNKGYVTFEFILSILIILIVLYLMFRKNKYK